MAAKKATFEGAMSKVNPKAWEKARKAEPGGSGNFGEIPDIEDGVYPCVVTAARSGCDKNGTPWASFTLTVEKGQYEGTKLDKYHSIKDQEKDLEYLVKTLKGMGYEEPGPKVAAGTWVAACIKDAISSKPRILVRVENDEYEGKKGENAGKMVRTLRIYVNRPLSDDEDGMDDAPTASPKKAAATKKTAKKAPAKKR